MNKLIMSLLGVSLSVLIYAAESSLPEMKILADQMLIEATEHYKQIGKTAAMLEFNDTLSERWVRQPYHQHLFAMSVPDGTVWADNVFVELVGLDFRPMTDAHGRPFAQDIIANTSLGGIFSVVLHWLNPVSHQVVDSYGACTLADEDNVLCVFTEDED